VLNRATRFCLLVVLVLLALSPIATAQGTVVEMGSDYFQSVPGMGDTSGTYFNFSSLSAGQIGLVDFMGVPIGPYTTDTIVQRQADATLNGAAIPLQLVALSLASEAPVLVGGNLYNVSLTLNNAFASTGMMMIMGNTTTGGTFTSSLNVFFDAAFKPVAGGSPFDVKAEATLTNSGTQWSPKPNGLLVYGPLGDQLANCHFSPSGACLPVGGSEVDFFIAGGLINEFEGIGQHVVVPVSEPAALFLIVPAVIGMFWKLGMRRSARVRAATSDCSVEAPICLLRPGGWAGYEGF